jgi:hypothetical protein
MLRENINMVKKLLTVSILGILFIPLTGYGSEEPVGELSHPVGPGIAGALDAWRYAIRPTEASYIEDRPLTTANNFAQNLSDGSFASFKSGFTMGMLTFGALGGAVAKNFLDIGFQRLDEIAAQQVNGQFYSSIGSTSTTRFTPRIPAHLLTHLLAALAGFLNIHGWTLRFDVVQHYYNNNFNIRRASIMPGGDHTIWASLGFLMAHTTNIYLNPTNSKMINWGSYMVTAYAALLSSFYASDKNPNPDFPEKYFRVDYDFSEIVQIATTTLWTWLLVTENQQVSNYFQSFAQKYGMASGVHLRTALAVVSVLAKTAYSYLEVEYTTAMALGALAFWGIKSRNPQVNIAIGTVAALWTLCGFTTNLFMFLIHPDQ